PQLWARLLEAMKRPDLAEDPRFATPLARRQHWPALLPIISAWLDTFGTRERAMAALRAARLPTAPVLSPAEVVAHPHLEARRTSRAAFSSWSATTSRSSSAGWPSGPI